jgi:hypothetical protein
MILPTEDCLDAVESLVDGQIVLLEHVHGEAHSAPIDLHGLDHVLLSLKGKVKAI